VGGKLGERASEVDHKRIDTDGQRELKRLASDLTSIYLCYFP